MGYGEDLRLLLEPLGVYSFSGYSGGEISVLGAALDAAEEYIEKIQKDFFLTTAGVRGVADMEALFPMLPMEMLADRRAALEVLLKTTNGSFTKSAIIGTLTACGVPVSITEKTNMQVTVTLDTPLSMGADPVFRIWMLEQVLPCHLSVTCSYTYTDPTTGQTVQEQAALSVLRQRTREEWEDQLGESA